MTVGLGYWAVYRPLPRWVPARDVRRLAREEAVSVCVVEVGRHPGPNWLDRNSGIVVCSRHRAQYEERADEFGPFDWVPA